MNKGYPACLHFTRQDSVSVWDESTVLDAMEEWLEENKESFRRFSPTTEMVLGRIDIYCTTSEHFHKIRSKYSELRGIV